MPATDRELLRRGYPQADVDLARKQHEAEKRAGSPPRSLASVLAGTSARVPTAPADLTTRQLRRRGRSGQAALLLDQEALAERDPIRATQLRAASNIVKGLAPRLEQLEFGFFRGGNVSVGNEYQDVISARLKATGLPGSELRTAIATLATIVRWLGWQTYECEKTAAELADLLDMDASNMARTLKLLERVGAIARVKRGRTKIIAVTPEGAYRGDINRHAEAVDRYQAEVIQIHPPVA